MPHSVALWGLLWVLLIEVFQFSYRINLVLGGRVDVPHRGRDRGMSHQFFERGKIHSSHGRP
jgi:hypothetical protein